MGCIVGRHKHGKRSARLLRNHPSFTFLKDRIGADYLECLGLVITAHESYYNLQHIEEAPYHMNIRHKFLCAFFRLLDGCEINSSRNSEALYNILKSHKKLKTESLKHWESHRAIISLVFDRNEIVIRYNNKTKASFQTKHLEDELQKINDVFRSQHIPELTVRLVKST